MAIIMCHTLITITSSPLYRIPIEANSIESILCEAIKLEYEAYTSMGTYQSTSRDLNDAERAKLNELIVANKALLTPVDDDLSSLISNDSGFKVSAGNILFVTSS